MRWFQDLTGLPTHDRALVQATVKLEGPQLRCLANGRLLSPGQLLMPTLNALRQAPPATPASQIALSEVVADVQSLHLDPANAGAVFQVASQFNLLEMVNPTVSPEDGIARYAFDQTQGPARAMACGTGTLWRNDFVCLNGGIGQTKDRQIDCLADLGAALGNTHAQLWSMTNGYVLPKPGALGRIAGKLTAMSELQLDALRGLLRIGIQFDTEVTLNIAQHRVTQIYCSALPIAYGNDRTQDWEPFAKLVLEAAYEATFRAALRYGKPGQPLFLTLLGGGAFGNPKNWIVAAIRRATVLFKSSGLDVRLVSFGAPTGSLRGL